MQRSRPAPTTTRRLRAAVVIGGLSLALVVLVTRSVTGAGTSPPVTGPPRRLPAAPSAAPAVVRIATTTAAAAHVTHAPPASAASPRALPFACSRDLWALAQAALRSRDVDEVVEGRDAARECAGIVANRDDIDTFLGGGDVPSIPGTLTPARQRALWDMKARCRGFFDVGAAASRAVRAKLDARLEAEWPARRRPELLPPEHPERHVQALLASASPQSVGVGLQLIAPFRAAALGLNEGDPAHDDLTFAEYLARCELVDDCAEGRMPEVVGCGLYGHCRPLDAGWDDDLPPARATQVQRWREALVEAVRRRDWAALGLADPPPPR